MNTLLALCAFVLSLAGVDLGAGTFVHQLREGGAEVLHSRAVVQAGVGYIAAVVGRVIGLTLIREQRRRDR